MKLRLLFVLLASSLFLSSAAQAQKSQDKLLIAMGGGYSDIYPGFMASVFSKAVNNSIKILVLPVPFASNPESITATERANYLQTAEKRRLEIEEACQQAAPTGVTCTATLVPIFTRSDAQDPSKLSDFTPDPTAIFILDGDQAIGMQVIAGTPVEKVLEEAYQRGVIIAGTSAGGGMLSATMLAGYRQNFTAGNALEFGAADVWNTAEKHGLLFGIPNAIVDQHFFQQGNLGRLLNAISLPDVPHLGIGIDADTGVYIPDGSRLERVFGRYTVTVLDAQTYHAANAVQYHGPRNTLSLRNVLVQMLAPGSSAYNLDTMAHSLGAPPARLVRTFDSLNLPLGAGVLFLGGDLSDSIAGSPILSDFVNHSQGEKANILIIAAGFATDSSAKNAADRFAAALPVTSQTLFVSQGATQPLSIPQGYTGIILTVGDQSRIQPQLLLPLKRVWLSGMPVLADGAAAAVLGAYFSAHEPIPTNSEANEIAAQESLLQGKAQVAKGLSFMNLTLEPQILDGNHWGYLFSLAYNHPNLLALGLTDGTALEITSQGAQVLGDNALFVLDFRHARLDSGTNKAFVIANGLLDVFAPADLIKPESADVKAAPIHAPTPVLATLTQTAAPTATATATLNPSPTQTSKPSSKDTNATRTPKPTSTPIPTPPPADIGKVNLMIFFGVLAVVIVIIGVWVNRQRTG